MNEGDQVIISYNGTHIVIADKINPTAGSIDLKIFPQRKHTMYLTLGSGKTPKDFVIDTNHDNKNDILVQLDYVIGNKAMLSFFKLINGTLPEVNEPVVEETKNPYSKYIYMLVVLVALVIGFLISKIAKNKSKTKKKSKSHS